jgi:hypothetical protein
MTEAWIRVTRAAIVAAILAAGCADDKGDGGEGASCGDGTVEQNGACIPAAACGAGTRLDPGTASCVPGDDVCSAGTILVGDRCEPVDTGLEADAVEAEEPNDADVAGTIVVPDAAAADPFIAYGCVEPRDMDGDGEYDVDLDAWTLAAAGPTIIELESVGVGGLAPAFGLFGRDARLVVDGWTRQAMDTADGHSIWRLLLPAAGDYDLVVSDARTVISGLPAGGPDACYYALVRQLPLPESVSPPADVDVFTLESGVRFYAIEVADGEVARLIGETPRVSTTLGLTLLIDGQYDHSVSEEVVPFTTGVPAEMDIDATVTGEVVIAVDASIDFGFAPVEARFLERRLPASPPEAGAAATGGR